MAGNRYFILLAEIYVGIRRWMQQFFKRYRVDNLKIIGWNLTLGGNLTCQWVMSEEIYSFWQVCDDIGCCRGLLLTSFHYYKLSAFIAFKWILKLANKKKNWITD